MNILIINQHTSNHGDEAAGKALIRGLKSLGLGNNIDILYNVDNLLDIEKFKIDQKNQEYHSKKASFIDKILVILTFIIPFSIIKKFYCFGYFTKHEYNLINRYNKIINGPGGVNIGPYRDWKYIWRLYISLKLKKDVAIYSISFGPIPKTYLFNKISKYILTNVKFLSLRDNKSQQYAEELKIDYIKSIDTAFLNNQPPTNIPEELSIKNDDDYVIVVPNELNKWHPNFKNLDDKDLDEVYVKIINYFIEKDLKVVLLPQLYGAQNDSEYFVKLKKMVLDEESVIVVGDKYTSDVQQKIIANAKFLVGARYHTVIFSVNNKRPFLSLAYEHKMTNTLEILHLENNNILIKDIIDKKIDIVSVLNNKYNIRDKTIINVKKGSDMANCIAIETLDLLINKFLL